MKVRQKNHGDCGTKLYNSWRGMKQRCYDSSQKSYHATYKSIEVCGDWLRYAPFKEWAISNGYKEGLTIERINPKGDYEPSNCEWITKGENSRRRNLQYDYSKRKVVGRVIVLNNGGFVTVKEYCKLKGLVYNSFRSRLNNMELVVKEKDIR
jgi:hypothetical protein